MRYEPLRKNLSVEVLAIAADAIISEIQNLLYKLIDFNLNEEDVKLKANISINPLNEKDKRKLDEEKRKMSLQT